MKACVFLLFILPLALAAPQERFVLDQLDGLFSLDALKKDVQTMLDVVGSDPSEQACEQECHKLVQQSILDTGCPLICHSFQALVNRFNLTPDVTTTAGSA